jgi:hypothetical protein
MKLLRHFEQVTVHFRFWVWFMVLYLSSQPKCWCSAFAILLCVRKGPSWSWLYGSWIYNYICLSPLTLRVRILRCTTASVRSVLYIANITNVVVYEAIATLWTGNGSLSVLGLVYGVLRLFQQYFSYIVVVNFFGGGNRSTRRKPPTHILN